VLNSPFPRYLQAHSPVHFLSFVSVRRYCAQLPARAPVIVRNRLVVEEKPVGCGRCTGLLANCALHAAAISGGLAIVWLVEQLRAGSAKTSESRRKLLLCAMIVLGFLCFCNLDRLAPKRPGFICRFHARLSPSFLHSALASVLAPNLPARDSVHPFLDWRLSLFSAPGEAFYTFFRCCFFAAFSGNVIGYFWHWGLVVPLLICLLWITWSSPGADMSLHEFVGRAALIYMVGVQIIWSAYALNFDHYSAYSPNLTTAQF